MFGVLAAGFPLLVELVVGDFVSDKDYLAVHELAIGAGVCCGLSTEVEKD